MLKKRKAFKRLKLLPIEENYDFIRIASKNRLGLFIPQ